MRRINRANIILTNNCNLRCLHCYIDAKSCKENTNQIYEDTKKIIDKLFSDNITSVMFTGGECMIFPHLKELIMYAKQLGMKVTIFTNGMIYDPTIYDLVDFINLSIDGDKKIHNSIRQNANSFDNIIKVLKYLKKRDIKTSVQMTINDLNINKIKEVADLAFDYLNIRNIKLVMTSDIGRAKENNILNNEKNIKLVLDQLDDLYKRTKYHIQFIPNIISKYDFESYYIKDELPFAIWFDMPKQEYYIFSKDYYVDNIQKYSIDKINAKNKEIFDIIKNNRDLIEKNNYINLEDILIDIIKEEK